MEDSTMKMAMLFVVITSLSLLKPIFACGEDLGSDSVHFSYSGSTGPGHWGSLSPEYQMCSAGKLQSPINIVNNHTVINPSLKALDIQYHHSINATLINNGFNVQVRYDGDAGVLVLNGKNYVLKQIHWHTPSEHQVDETQFAAELHLVHNALDKRIVVIAIFLQSGQPNPILAEIQQQLGELPNRPLNQNPPEIALGNVNVQELIELLINTDKYYTYYGSLTAPPCTEGVTWIVIEKVGTISNDQVEALKRRLDDGSKNNARPLQDLNERKVEIYKA